MASKQLQPVYDKPMIYYPLATLMMAGIKEILIISTPHDTPRFQALLGDGSRFGVRLSYEVQPEPKGIAQAFLVGEEFVAGDPVCLILGDNIFYGKMGLDRIAHEFTGGARVFGYPVSRSRALRGGGIRQGRAGAEHRGETEARRNRISPSPAFISMTARWWTLSVSMKPSARGELEITDVNLEYLRRGELTVEKLGRGIAWLDTGTHMSLLEASHFIGTLEARQGLKIACLEEIALRKGFIDRMQLERIVAATPKSSYREYLEAILRDGVEL